MITQPVKNELTPRGDFLRGVVPVRGVMPAPDPEDDPEDDDFQGDELAARLGSFALA